MSTRVEQNKQQGFSGLRWKDDHQPRQRMTWRFCFLVAVCSTKDRTQGLTQLGNCSTTERYTSFIFKIH